MSDRDEAQSARVQSRATIWSALIGSVGIVTAAWVGLGVGRNQGEDKLATLQQELRLRDTEIERLREEFQAQKVILDQLRKDLREERKTVGPPGSSDPVSRVADSAKPVVSDGFRFQLRACQRSGGTISCTLTITSLDQDRTLLLAAEQTGGIRRTGVCFSRAVDSNGSEFLASAVVLGNKGNESNGQVESELVGGVATETSLLFERAESRGDSWPLVELCGYSRRAFRVQFRDVTISA